MHVSIVGRCRVRSGVTYRYIHVDARQGESAIIVGGGVRHDCRGVAVIRCAIEGSQCEKSQMSEWYVCVCVCVEIDKFLSYEDATLL